MARLALFTVAFLAGYAACLVFSLAFWSVYALVFWGPR